MESSTWTRTRSTPTNQSMMDKVPHLTLCPICGASATYAGDTIVGFGGDETYPVARYLCMADPEHTLWVTYAEEEIGAAAPSAPSSGAGSIEGEGA
jgi:hypothetical protein